MGKSKFLVFFLLLIFPDLLFAQLQTFFISFKSKYPNSYSIDCPEAYLSKRSIERRERQGIDVNVTDLPVSQIYLDSLKSINVEILSSSKWLNGAMVQMNEAQLKQLYSCHFVKSIQHISSLRSSGNSAIQSVSNVQSVQEGITKADYGLSYTQITMPGLDVMHSENIYGNGVLIAVIDDGFKNVNSLPAFDSLFYYNRILDTYDFVNNEVNVYNDGGGHGTHVLSILGGYSQGNLIGAAWKANFLLLRSESNAGESIEEEYNWVRAAEFADDAGADIISSSLGYNEFDNSADNHQYSDLNGDSTVITKGADIAASKGILVVSAAGNEGNTSWKYVLAPSDADSVLTVGGVNGAGEHIATSSIGPTYDGRIKPDVVTFSSQVRYASFTGGYSSGGGTSYATPVITGLAAGLWQKYPHLTNMELIDFIRVSSSQFYHPDNEKGYGIPNYRKAVNLIEASRAPVIFPNPTNDTKLHLHLAVYQKNQEVEVVFYSVTGQLMASEKTYVESPIVPLSTDIRNWKTGIYLIKVVTSTSQFTIRLVRF